MGSETGGKEEEKEQGRRKERRSEGRRKQRKNGALGVGLTGVRGQPSCEPHFCQLGVDS